MAVTRIFIEKKPEFRQNAARLKDELTNFLNVNIEDLRLVTRIDIDGLNANELEEVKVRVLIDSYLDEVTASQTFSFGEGYSSFSLEFLAGQYDQRSDFAKQSIVGLLGRDDIQVAYASVYAFKNIKPSDLLKIKSYLLNPVESQEASNAIPATLKIKTQEPSATKLIDGFVDFDAKKLKEFYSKMNFSFNFQDLEFIQSHFKKIYRNPTETELKALDTYWSDHCRHTTFLTRLKKVDIASDIKKIDEVFKKYLALFNKHYEGKTDKFPSLMDIALMAPRELRSRGKLEHVEQSKEVNACSMLVPIDIDGKSVDYTVMFKNETHNHPTEIEPYGGAATALGGGIRDPLSGRVRVYQSMRVTGAADINAPFKATLKGKLAQRYLTKTAASGFSSYANIAGLAGGIVKEYYHSGYAAKRLEAGFTVGASPTENIVRGEPSDGDIVLYIGGATGRDGLGGAVGSSKAHTGESILGCSAEVQKGTPVIGRALQRLFSNAEFAKKIKRSNDFGAGGVSVCVGEIADGVDINLDAVPLKYDGLSATEIALSESQERMAVVIEKGDVDAMVALASEQNLNAVPIATVTNLNRMRMFFKGNMVLDLDRDFLNSNGIAQSVNAKIVDKVATGYFNQLDKETANALKKSASDALKVTLANCSVASQKGQAEMFDNSVGGFSVFSPFGGKYQLTPANVSASKIPVLTGGFSDATTVAAIGFDPNLSSVSPFTGAVYAVLNSIIKVVITGVPLCTVLLTFQEYFERLKDIDTRWGKPVAALLGALFVQLGLEVAAIGGKDSMSGSFEKLDVPPTLISFAIGVGKANKLADNVFKSPGAKVYRYSLTRDESGIPDLETTKEFLNLLQGEVVRGNISYTSIVEDGGVAAAVAKSCFGNGFGFIFKNKSQKIFTPNLGDILFTSDTVDDFVGHNVEFVGQVTADKTFVFGADDSLTIKEAQHSFTKTFEDVYPVRSKCIEAAEVENINYTASIDSLKGKVKDTKKDAKKETKKNAKLVKKLVKVVIPILPDTNGELELERKFKEAGAAVCKIVINTQNAVKRQKSIDKFIAAITQADIFALANGFSTSSEGEYGDVFSTPFLLDKKVKAALEDLLSDKRCGLVLGIGSSSTTALIEAGLIVDSYGELATNVSFTSNNIGRHVSSLVRVRISSNLSPWLSGLKLNDTFVVPFSSASGKFTVSPVFAECLTKNGQIAAQFVDLESKASMQSCYNPSGSHLALAAITSPSGRVLGVNFNPERVGIDLYKNVLTEEEKTELDIFKNAVGFFNDKL